ncbi:hypothetical protein CAPTEDRAFT_186405 [Capitella teleta]|uniref:F5/8 type C domain-containing protein n=1 Tax=Capitella teleta TaxID=283909 RepID=R7UB59_CAPTE|nr:hypothetical protein CAPTEDRAFT_186405 [Capitella teleta]|eukprot:ELU00482.1 hypothetical protein CAPTEDRAFT_186405 [Capitella teleta]
MEAPTLTSVIGVYLFLTCDMSAAIVSSKCFGYESLLVGVEDYQLLASSEYTQSPVLKAKESRLTYLRAERARDCFHLSRGNQQLLKGQKTRMQLADNGAARGWQCAGNDGNPWIQVDLLHNKIIEGVVTMGDAGLNRFVKTFRIQHLSDGSSTWVDVANNNTDRTIFDANTDAFVPVWNEFKGGIVARYVRLYPLTFTIYRVLRWELIACREDIQPSVDYLLSMFITSRDLSTTECIKCIDTANNEIRMRLKGIVINSKVTNLVLGGKALICTGEFIKIGIEMNRNGCIAEYALCKIEATDVEGTCHAACNLRDGQIGQPSSLLLMVTGDDAELCDNLVGLHGPEIRCLIPSLGSWRWQKADTTYEFISNACDPCDCTLGSLRNGPRDGACTDHSVPQAEIQYEIRWSYGQKTTIICTFSLCSHNR